MSNLRNDRSQYLKIHNWSEQLENVNKNDWRSLIHPQISQKYELLKNQKLHGLSVLRGPQISNNEDARSTAWQKSLLQKIPDSTFDDARSNYEARISVLQHQNINLKQELFFLRQAVLQIYTKKQQNKIDQNL